MRSWRLIGAGLLLLTHPGVTQTPARGVPWFGFGPNDTIYLLSVDTSVAYSGHRSLLLQSLPGATSTTWIASQQIVDARMYRGRRVRIRARLRTESATSAGLWLVVAGFSKQTPANLLSDSLVPSLHGTRSWTEVSVVFDVDSHASCIRYGSMLNGTGAVWLDDIGFDTVSSSTPVTSRPTKPDPIASNETLRKNCERMVARPTNLDFEEAP